MKVTETFLKGCFIIEPTVFEDERGYFMESYNKERFEKATQLAVDFIQDNEARSSYGVIRGLHFQKGKHSQAKLVRVMEGKVLDVALDLRKDSDTFGKHVALELSGENRKQLFVPRGFAHGYSVLSETALFFYKCDNVYSKDSESGIAYDDAQLSIDWKIPFHDQIISLKDQNLPAFASSLKPTKD
ncbi:dTDP-4-dehydrorhamnose 3,5-epimerase [Nonlabens antarcticus]|uniref:dTDP-4-dehydrorhamnose 3,5-epimerase n=1 Tax=Nonlabens antarcticus TaxID=392714 RepID=UPI001891D59A|nr:dTDP-4-dehydrorhamnose 3,5-epimerase [Nonlabens antarcticus]